MIIEFKDFIYISFILALLVSNIFILYNNKALRNGEGFNPRHDSSRKKF